MQKSSSSNSYYNKQQQQHYSNDNNKSSNNNSFWPHAAVSRTHQQPELARILTQTNCQQIQQKNTKMKTNTATTTSTTSTTTTETPTATTILMQQQQHKCLTRRKLFTANRWSETRQQQSAPHNASISISSETCNICPSCAGSCHGMPLALNTPESAKCSIKIAKLI